MPRRSPQPTCSPFSSRCPSTPWSQAAVAGARRGTVVILNAAPIRDLPPELLANLDVLVVNEHEAAHLAGDRDWRELTARRTCRRRYPRSARARFCCVADHDEVRVAAPVVVAVDATGAGDTFCGAFAAAIAEGTDYEAALRFAVVAGSLSVETPGAVPSIPMRAAIDARVNEGNEKVTDSL